MAENAIEGGATNAWQEAVIDKLPPAEALMGVEREVMEYDVVIVGEDPASQVYVRNKVKACEDNGVFSLLDTMLGISMEEGLASVTLPDSVTQALLHRTGPLAPYLELTIACETGDDEAFARNATLLGLNNNQVNWNHVQALAWAESIGI